MSNLLTDGDFQSATAFTFDTYTAGTSSDCVWYASNWTKVANTGPAGTGDTAANVTNNWADLRLLQGFAAPISGTQLTLSFDYVRPSGLTGTVQVLGLTTGQYIQQWAGGTIQGTQLFSYSLGNQASWTSVTNQTFTVGATYAKLVVLIRPAATPPSRWITWSCTRSGHGNVAGQAPRATHLAVRLPRSSARTLMWWFSKRRDSLSGFRRFFVWRAARDGAGYRSRSAQTGKWSLA